jgi:methionine-S-sulfoxide reductase
VRAPRRRRAALLGGAALALLGATAAAALDVPGGAVPADARVAIFATGCFWCTEADFEKLPGVHEAVSGYIGGAVPNPSYEQVAAGGTGHAEAVRVYYDPETVTYERLLEKFWHTTDLLDAGGQFCDRGDQYRSAIFYEGEEQRRLAEASRAELAAGGRFDRPIATEIAPAGPFYPAEAYHQDYYEKNSWRYSLYRWNCGRDRRLEELWAGAGS